MALRPGLLAAALLLLFAPLLPAAATAYSAPDPAYLALGDSLAFGVGASDPATQGYVALTAQALRDSERYDGALTLVNLAVPGATSGDLLAPDGQLDGALEEIARRAEDSTAGNEVEIVSLDIGGNDLLTLAQANSPCLLAPAGEECMQRLTEVLGGLQSNLAEALQRLRQAAPGARLTIVDLYNPYSGTGTAIEAIADIGIQQLNGVIRAAASDPELAVRLASVFQLFQGRARQWIAADGIHPNDTGHAVIAEVLLAAMDGRPPRIPEDVLNVPPDAGFGAGNDSAGDDGDGLPLALMIAVPAAFLAGIALSSAYFLARGRT